MSDVQGDSTGDKLAFWVFVVGPKAVATGMAVVASHFAFRNAFGGWIWLSDGLVALVAGSYEWLFGTSMRTRLSTQTRLGPAGPPPAATNAPVGEGEPRRGAWLWHFKRLFAVAVVLTVLHFAVGNGLESKGGWAPLLPVVVLTIYSFHQLHLEMRGVFLFAALQVREDPDEAVNELGLIVENLVCLLGILTLLFAGWIGFWHEQGWIDAAVPFSGRQALAEAERLCLWTLADAIPLLSVPDTLHWAEPTGFLDWHAGVLVLLYKVIVILPLVGGFVALYRAVFTTRQAT